MAAVGTKDGAKVIGVARRFFLFFVPLFVLMTAVVAVFFVQELKNWRRGLEADERMAVALMQETAAGDMKSIVTDLLYLSSHHVLRQVLESSDPASRRELSQAFEAFSRDRGLYDQIRFLDETGMERVRVDYGAGRPHVVAEDQLQNKAKRYYFADTFKLTPGRLFVSPLDLNIERGEIELPLKPMIRIGTPVVDLAGRKRGIVLVNYYGARLIDNLARVAAGALGSGMLLNAEGYWLKGLRAEDEWGFMYDDRKDRTLARHDPEAWDKIVAADTGQVSTDQGLYTFTTVRPMPEGMSSSSGSGEAFKPSESELAGRQYYWKVVSLVSADVLAGRLRRVLFHWLGAYVLAVVVLGAISWRLAAVTAFHKQSQNSLRVGHDELAGKVEELAVARDRAEGADRLKSAFLASMSHELRTSLNSIIGFTGIILQGLAGPLNEEQTKQMEMVQGSARHLLELINDVLDISKIEAGQLTIRSESFDMRETVEKVGRTVSPLAEKKGLSLVVDAGPEIGPITSDRRRVEQILINLVGNAVKFTDRGQVRLECHFHNHSLVTRVVDTGIGIEAEDMDTLFEAFRQVDSGLARRHEGTGLGLFICTKLAAMLGGEIQAESVWGQGSTFALVLPKEAGETNESDDSDNRG